MRDLLFVTPDTVSHPHIHIPQFDGIFILTFWAAALNSLWNCLLFLKLPASLQNSSRLRTFVISSGVSQASATSRRCLQCSPPHAQGPGQFPQRPHVYYYHWWPARAVARYKAAAVKCAGEGGILQPLHSSSRILVHFWHLVPKLIKDFFFKKKITYHSKFLETKGCLRCTSFRWSSRYNFHN